MKFENWRIDLDKFLVFVWKPLWENEINSERTRFKFPDCPPVSSGKFKFKNKMKWCDLIKILTIYFLLLNEVYQ
jgi:hypothetical protein